MRVRLGSTKVTIKTDGGISLYPGSTSCHFPVFCIEVCIHTFKTLIPQAKRKKHRLRRCEAIHQMHAAQIYAEMLGQILSQKSVQREWPSRSHSSIPLSNVQAFLLHARHATFYMFYCRFSNSYLRHIARYGAEYTSQIPNAEKIQLLQSRPFRMRYPTHQSDFFRLLAHVLCYLVSGNSSVGFLAKDDWNPYFKMHYGLQVCSMVLPRSLANSQRREMYECVKVRSFREQDTILDAEGELDNESDLSDIEMSEYKGGADSRSVTSSTHAEPGSPMSSN